MPETPAALQVVLDLIAQEASALDERRWDDWIALYEPDCEYWVPTWVDEETLACSPQTELSQIYYQGRAGLEDRLARIRSGKSPASTPLRRTTHMTSHARVLEGSDDHRILARSSWTCHVFDPADKTTFVLFGHARYRLARGPAGWKIAAKTIVVQNDYLPAMVDIYCL